MHSLESGPYDYTPHPALEGLYYNARLTDQGNLFYQHIDPNGQHSNVLQVLADDNSAKLTWLQIFGRGMQCFGNRLSRTTEEPGGTKRTVTAAGTYLTRFPDGSTVVEGPHMVTSRYPDGHITYYSRTSGLAFDSLPLPDGTLATTPFYDPTLDIPSLPPASTEE